MIILDVHATVLWRSLPPLTEFEHFSTPVLFALVIFGGARLSGILRLAFIEVALMIGANYVLRMFPSASPLWRIPGIVLWILFALTCCFALRGIAHREPT